MIYTRAFVLALASLAFVPVCAGAGPPGKVSPLNPPEGRFSDEWAEVYMAGGKVGYTHSTMAREGNLIHTSNTTKMKVGRLESTVEIAVVQTTTETLGGVPLRFETVTEASVMKSAVRGMMLDGKVTIVTSQYGMERTQTFEFSKGALMTWGGYRESLLRGFQPGTEYTLQIYAPELRLDAPVSAATRVGEWTTFEHLGVQRKGQLVIVELETPMGTLELKSWVDEHGRPLKALVPAPGLGDLVLVTCDQATALTDFLPPEIFMRTVIKADRKLVPSALERVKYLIRSTRPDVQLGDLPVTGMQRPFPRGDGSIELIVVRQSRKSARPRATSRADLPETGKSSGPDMSEYLESNLMINTDDPELVALARRAADGETEPYALADKLRRFVTGYVKTKSLNIGFATASEVCRTREGDCSEHGVLLAALGRLNGLPSRIAVGVAYVPRLAGENGAFGYHLWTQFFVDGEWVDFDAALGEQRCSPTHIAFATSSLKNSGMADLSLPLLSKIGAIDIDILEVE